METLCFDVDRQLVVRVRLGRYVCPDLCPCVWVVLVVYQGDTTVVKQMLLTLNISAISLSANDRVPFRCRFPMMIDWSLFYVSAQSTGHAHECCIIHVWVFETQLSSPAEGESGTTSYGSKWRLREKAS